MKRGRKCLFFFWVVLVEVEESEEILVWKDYSKISVLHQSNSDTCHFCYTKKNHSFLMSPTVGDLFKSPTGNGTLVSFYQFGLAL